MDRVLHYSMALVKGYETTTCPDPREIASYLTAVRPHLFIAVPRAWEKLKAGVEAALAAQPAERRHAAEAAIAAGVQAVRLREAGVPVPPELAAALERADAALFAGLRERLGIDQVTMAGTGAAPISRDVLEFFHAIGVELLQGYAMSESGCLGSVGRTGDPRARQRRAAARQHRDPARSRRRDPDARTVGDGRLPRQPGGHARGDRRRRLAAHRRHRHADADGALTIVDRKKELIITSGGKNVSPAKVESELKAASPAIAHACAVGDRRPYLTALLVLEPGADARASRPRSRPPTSGSRGSSRSSATRSWTTSGGPGRRTDADPEAQAPLRARPLRRGDRRHVRLSQAFAQARAKGFQAAAKDGGGGAPVPPQRARSSS